MSILSRMFERTDQSREGQGQTDPAVPASNPAPDLGLVEFFVTDHRACDAFWAEVEAAADQGDAQAVASAWQRFETAMRRHLAMEEEVLFPAFEEASGMSGGGPTFVMRAEHAQMRGVLDQMANAVARGSDRDLLDQGDTLLMLIQQHNAKEEAMLYPMSQRFLDADWPALRDRLARY